MFRERVAEVVRKVVPEKVRDLLEGLRPEPAVAQEPPPSPRQELHRARRHAVERHARAVDDIFEARQQGGAADPDQARELKEARGELDALRDGASRDMETAYKKDPALAAEAAGGNIGRAVRAMQLETEIRTDPALRADRFVDRWNKLERQSQRAYEAGDMQGHKSTRSDMASMAKSLQRDPQLESILANRKIELGITFETGRSLGAELALNHGIDMGHGLGIGM